MLLTVSRVQQRYPWSLYAVFQTTVTQWAFLLDCALLASAYLAFCEAGYYPADEGQLSGADKWQRSLLWALFIAHWVFAKTIKLVPHLLRNPGDVRFVPVSILFGYFHNLIKLYGCITVTEVCVTARVWRVGGPRRVLPVALFVLFVCVKTRTRWCAFVADLDGN